MPFGIDDAFIAALMSAMSSAAPAAPAAAGAAAPAAGAAAATAAAPAAGAAGAPGFLSNLNTGLQIGNQARALLGGDEERLFPQHAPMQQSAPAAMPAPSTGGATPSYSFEQQADPGRMAMMERFKRLGLM